MVRRTWSATRSWSLVSRSPAVTLRMASAVMTSSSMSRNKNGAALKRAGMNGFEHLVDLVERMLFDERRDLDPAVEHQFERLRIEVRGTAPVSDRPGVERHQVGEADLDLVHGEADDSKRCAVIKQ